MTEQMTALAENYPAAAELLRRHGGETLLTYLGQLHHRPLPDILPSEELLDEVRDTGQAAPRAAWPKPRRYLLAAAIVGAVGVAAVRFIWAAVAAAMIGEFTSVDMDLIWAEDMVGASVAPVLQRYTLLSVLNTVFMVLLAAGGIGAIFYYPILRLWEKYGKRGE